MNIPAGYFHAYKTLFAAAKAGTLPATSEAISLGSGASTTSPALTILAIEREIKQRWAGREHATWNAVLVDRAAKLEILAGWWEKVKT